MLNSADFGVDFVLKQDGGDIMIPVMRDDASAPVGANGTYLFELDLSMIGVPKGAQVMNVMLNMMNCVLTTMNLLH